MSSFDLPKKDPSAQARGWKAKALGTGWEDTFELRCRICDVAIEKIEDGCRQVGRRLQRVKQPFDWMMGFQGAAAFVDTKRTQGIRFVYSAIDRHQLAKLKNLSVGGRSGYVVHFGSGKVVYFDHKVLSGLVSGSSLSDSEGVLLGVLGDFDPRKIFSVPV